MADPGSNVVSIEQGQNEDGSAFMKVRGASWRRQLAEPAQGLPLRALSAAAVLGLGLGRTLGVQGSRMGAPTRFGATPANRAVHPRLCRRPQIEISSVQGDEGEGGEEDDGELDFQAAAADYNRDEDDGIRTIDDLAASVGMQDGQSMASGDAGDSASGEEASARGEVDEEEEEQLRKWRQQAAGGGSPPIPEDVDALTAALLGAAEAAQSQQWSREGGDGGEAGDDEAVEVPSTAAKLGAILQRTPAHITWSGRDSFTVTVSEPPALVQQRRQYEVTAAASAAAAAAVPALQQPPVRIIYDGKEQLRQRQQQEQQQQQDRQEQPAEGEQRQGQQAEARLQQPGDAQGPAAVGSAAGGSSQSGVNPDGSRDVEVTSEESDSEEISVLLSPAQQAQQARQAQQEQQEQQAQESAALAESLERVREQLEAGGKVDNDIINDIGGCCLCFFLLLLVMSCHLTCCFNSC